MRGVRRFTKPPESLERSLELSRHRCRKKTQKRPNYKNLGEEDDDERGGGGGSGGGEESCDDNSRAGEREKGKGTEGGGGGSSKGSRASGETAEGECVSRWIQQYGTVFCFCSPPFNQTQSPMMYPGYLAPTRAAALVSKQRKREINFSNVRIANKMIV